jgi:flagellin
VLQYTNSSNATVTVNGVGNVFTLTGELSGIKVTAAASTTPGSLLSVAPTNQSFNAGTDLVFQIGANAGQTSSLQIGRIAADSIGVGASTVFTTLSAIKVDTANNAQESISVIDRAINDVSTLRGKLGAFQSEALESTANNLRVTLENTTAAESVIRDTDFAQETANMTKYQVLMQVGTSVLTNANQTTQLILGLFR